MSSLSYASQAMRKKLVSLPKKPKERQLFLRLLREAREEADLRQADIARTLGVSQGFVSKYELGERRLDFLDLARVCDVLGISLSEFVKRFEDKRKGG